MMKRILKASASDQRLLAILDEVREFAQVRACKAETEGL